MSASPPKEPDVEQGARSENNGEQSLDQGDPQHAGMSLEFEVKEQDRWLPIANVARIMKMALPENAKIAKEAKECMQECVSEFISFITSEASEKCHQEKRKTVNGEDILFAMTSLGFENYAEALKIYLAKYRESQSARTEQHRPQSQGQGFNAARDGGATSGANAPVGGNFDAAQGSNNPLLGGQQTEASEHDPTGFGALYESGLSANQNGSAGGAGY